MSCKLSSSKGDLLCVGGIIAALVLSCGVSFSSDFQIPENTNDIKSLTEDAASDLVVVQKFERQIDLLPLDGLSEITVNVARELAKFEGEISLGGLSVITNDVAKELANCKAVSLSGIETIDEELAKIFATFKFWTGTYWFTDN